MRNENTFIMALEAKWIFKSATEEQLTDISAAVKDNKRPRDINLVYEPPGKFKDCDLLTGSLPYSLDVMQLDRMDQKAFLLVKRSPRSKHEVQATWAVISVGFKKDCRKWSDERRQKVVGGRGNTDAKLVDGVHKSEGTLINDCAMRQYLYEHGFWFRGTHYVAYKRSSSKARRGEMLFIWEDLAEPMLDWSRMGLHFEQGEPCNEYPSLKAYESLTLSGLEHTIKIQPDEILFIDDVIAEFPTSASVTRYGDDGLEVNDEEDFKGESNMFDGQSLMDESLFAAHGWSRGKGMMLLRNRFFKSCAFNTHLTLWLEDYAARTGKRTVRDQLTGEWKPVEKIKLVTTPSSLKIFKFASKITDATDKDVRGKACVVFWLKNVSHVFGVCKTEKSGPFGDCSNLLSYQMINSMPLTKADVAEVMKFDLELIECIKTNITAFREHVKANKPSLSQQFVANLLAVSNDAQYLDLVIDYRRKVVDRYKDKLRRGKLRIPNTDYCTIFGNPHAMLLRTVDEPITDTVHHGRELWCPMFDNGEMLIGCRNPHIASANVLTAKNVWDDRLRWFNLTDNIVCVNSRDNDLMDRLQGCDYDSDSMLLSSHPILVKRALECQQYKTPVNRIGGSDAKYIYMPEASADIDCKIAKNFIGQVVNLSQVLNSAYWQTAYDPVADNYDVERDRDLLDLINGQVSILSSLSQVEIDRAKKNCDIKEPMCHMLKGLKRIGNDRYDSIFGLSERDKKSKYVPDGQINLTNLCVRRLNAAKRPKEKKRIRAVMDRMHTKVEKREKRPLFFQRIEKDNQHIYEAVNTPMDFVWLMVDGIGKMKKSETKTLKEVINAAGIYMQKANRKQMKAIAALVKEYRNKQIASITDDDDGSFDNITSDYIDRLQQMKVSDVTIYSMMVRAYGKKRVKKVVSKADGSISKVKSEENQVRLTLMSLLHAAFPEQVMKFFETIEPKSRDNLCNIHTF